MRTAAGEVLAEPLVDRVVGEGAVVADRFTGADMLGARYEPPFAFLPGSEWGPKGHTVLPGDFVSADDGTGIVHTAIAFGEEDYRLGAEQGLAVVNPVGSTAPTTSASARTPAAGSRTPTTTSSRTCARAAACSAPNAFCTPTRTAGAAARRSSTTPSRPGTSARRRCATPARGQRDRRLVPAAHQARPLRQVAGGQRRLGDLTRALLGHAAARLALREQPRGVRSARSPRSRSAPAASCPTRTGPTSTSTPGRARSAARRCAASRSSSTSGSTPARCRSPSATRRSRTRRASSETFPADYICEAIDQTRGWFYSLIAISTLLFDGRRTAPCSASATSPTRRARRCRSRWATSSCPGTSSTSTAPTPSAGTT